VPSNLCLRSCPALFELAYRPASQRVTAAVFHAVPGGAVDAEARAPRKQQRFVEWEAEPQAQALPQPRTSRGSGSEIKQQVSRTSASQLSEEPLVALPAPPSLRPPPLPPPPPAQQQHQQQQQQPPHERLPESRPVRRDAFQGAQEGQEGGADPDPVHKAPSAGSRAGGASRRSSLSKERVPGTPCRNSLEVSWGPPCVLPAPAERCPPQPSDEASAAAAPAARSLQVPGGQADLPDGADLPQRVSGARCYDSLTRSPGCGDTASGQQGSV
jgi:hypothetical protein